jgi:hypothetical protein
MTLHTGQSYNRFVLSGDRVSGTSSDFIYAIPQLLGGSFDSVAVRRVHIPKSFWLISATRSFTVLQGVNQLQLQLTPVCFTQRIVCKTENEKNNRNCERVPLAFGQIAKAITRPLSQFALSVLVGKMIKIYNEEQNLEKSHLTVTL